MLDNESQWLGKTYNKKKKKCQKKVTKNETKKVEMFENAKFTHLGNYATHSRCSPLPDYAQH